MKQGGGIVSALWWVLSLCWPPLTASLLEIYLSMSLFKSMMEMTQVNAYLTHYLLLNILFKVFLVCILIIIDHIWFCFTVKKVRYFYVHPKYNVNARKGQGVDEFYDYDVALVQLVNPVKISILARSELTVNTLFTSCGILIQPAWALNVCCVFQHSDNHKLFCVLDL